MKLFKNMTGPAIFLCVMLVGLGGYVLYKNRDRDGFWWGALAVGLVATIILVGILDKPVMSMPSAAGIIAPAPIVPTPIVAPVAAVPITPPAMPTV